MTIRSDCIGIFTYTIIMTCAICPFIRMWCFTIITISRIRIGIFTCIITITIWPFNRMCWFTISTAWCYFIDIFTYSMACVIWPFNRIIIFTHMTSIRIPIGIIWTYLSTCPIPVNPSFFTMGTFHPRVFRRIYTSIWTSAGNPYYAFTITSITFFITILIPIKNTVIYSSPPIRLLS